MSKFCDACGRGALTAISRSKSMIATRRKQKINLQSKRIGGEQVKICARCIKTMSAKGTPVMFLNPHRAGKRSKKGR